MRRLCAIFVLALIIGACDEGNYYKVIARNRTSNPARDLYVDIDGAEKPVGTNSESEWSVKWHGSSYQEICAHVREISYSWGDCVTASYPNSDSFWVATLSDPNTISWSTEPPPSPSDGGGGTGPFSCPFIYSYDGRGYVLDAEPYGGAICEGLKRTEWCLLDYINEVHGEYRIIISNELEETQYTDELQLMVIDHPVTTHVAPDTSGIVHTIAAEAHPTSAHDRYGNSILPFIAEKDSLYWQTESLESGLIKEYKLRDELVIEFAKPVEAKTVKLIVNASTTEFGSSLAKEFLGLYGRSVSNWYHEVNTFGPAYQRVLDWYQNGGLYILEIFCEVNDKWCQKGHILGGGPFVSEDKVYLLDVHDVPGEVLRIKIQPPAHFWRLNQIAVDYSEDLAIEVAELNVTRAVAYDNQDLLGLLDKNDKKYLVMRNKGEWAALTFRAPKQVVGLKRSVILKASGYYMLKYTSEERPRYLILKLLQKYPELFAYLASSRNPELLQDRGSIAPTFLLPER